MNPSTSIKLSDCQHLPTNTLLMCSMYSKYHEFQLKIAANKLNSPNIHLIMQELSLQVFLKEAAEVQLEDLKSDRLKATVTCIQKLVC